MSVYASLTNGRGQLQLTLRCVRVTAEKEIFCAAGPINFPDPNQVVDMIFNLRGVPFEMPGLYTFELVCEGDLLLEKRFIVEQLKTT